MSNMVTRWVCSACKALWFQPQNGRCPSCGAGGKFQQCEEREDGTVVPVGDVLA